ncbi:MAG: hypothetical protein NUV69_03745 [Candidatus Curtissbacteria bacterium]|nr:hypothetical protein [Candidatus Curtissbacteria bacterium]
MTNERLGGRPEGMSERVSAARARMRGILESSSRESRLKNVAPIPEDEQLSRGWQAELNGEPTNPNTAFFITDTPDKGDRFYKVLFHADEVKQVNDSQNPIEREFEFDPDKIQPNPESAMGKRIMNSRFIHWTRAMQLRDMYTLAGVGRLAAWRDNI